MTATAKSAMSSTATATKTKKPSVSISTTATTKSGLPSSSPSSAAKRLPGAVQPPATPATTNGVAATNNARPSRRLQRLSTKTGTSDNVNADRKPTWYPEPFTITESHILKKYKGKSPSLVIHLHSNYFRFDGQDGSFAYNSEMRPIIEHLKKGTIPHDVLEELRRDNVRFYDGWLIVKVIDHKSVATDAAATNGAADDEKPCSIHNYNHFITPSPWAPYPAKEQSSKMERTSSTDKENLAPDNSMLVDLAMKSAKPKPKIFFRALAPTQLSRQVDLMLDCIAPDPKAKKPQNKPGQPPTPVGTVPPTPTSERPPPLKKQKTRIDPKDQTDYEAKIINATAPPLYLDPAQDLDESARILHVLSDPLCQEAPPSPKSRKRTVAELAADDAHAKGQERFMLIMDARGSGNAGANGAGVEAQPAAFQPRFERFNALDKIKSELQEKKRQSEEKRVQEDEIRRSQQQQLQEEENRRKAQQAAITQRKEQAILQQQQKQQQQQQMQMLAQRQTQDNMAAQQQQNARRTASNAAQPNGIPPQMQSQMMNGQASSPVIRQGTPNMASSPAAPIARNMARSGSQAAAASPPRPSSSLQHAHPAATANMMRQPSGQGGPSRNGTPQIPHSTPGMPNATPVMRQGTPAHSMTQQSPMVSMATPQMQQAAVMQGQMANGMHGMNPQQMQQMQMRNQQQQMLRMQMASSQINGQMNPQMMQQLQHQQALRQQQQAAAAQQAQGTPQQQHMSPGPQNQQAYNAQLRRMMQQQMPQQGSPNPQNQMSPQQLSQMQQMHMQQQQQNAMMRGQAQAQQQGGNPAQTQQQQQQPRMANPQHQQAINNLALSYFKQLMVGESQKYGGNPNMIPPEIKQNLQQQAHKTALMNFQRRQQNALAQQQAGGAGGNAQQQQHMNMANMNMNNPALAQQMAAMQQRSQNMAAMQQAQQHQQAQQMQQMHIQNAAQQLQAQQQAQQQASFLAQMQNGQGGSRPG